MSATTDVLVPAPRRELSWSEDLDDLGPVERELASAIGGPGGERAGLLEEAARGLCLSPGAKRVRPRVLRLFGAAAGVAPSALLDAAVAVEMIHSASLLHDDVVDASARRRGRPTANATYGNDVAVLAGDLVLSLALERLAPHGAALLGRALSVIEEMTRAALLEITWRGRADVTVDTWAQIARGKTGALFGLAAYCAGALGGAFERATRWAAASRHFGVAFQLADDLGDLLGGQGKDRFADLRERNPSYAIAAVAARSDTIALALTRSYANGAVQPSETARLGQLILDAGARELTSAAIAVELDSARALLGTDLAVPPIASIWTWAGRLIEHAATGGTP